jgi:plastocyanin
MRHLALLVAVYALTAALVLPSTLFAQENAEAPAPPPATTETAPAAPQATTPQAEPAPAPAAPVAPAPAAAEPAPAAPEPQVLADERDEAEPRALAAASGTVTVVDFSFNPGTITINQGDTVTWTNNGPTPHSATEPNGAFDTGIFPAGESRSHTFDEAGSFSYICTPHPNMRGTVVVQAAQSGGDTPDSSSGDTGDTTTGGDTTGEAAQAGGGPTLPRSGADAGALLLLGALMILLGTAVHRRARADQPHPAGRIGW